jgi:predicted Zn finger-like uncharacterized protein
MVLATRCPFCETVFRLQSAQLALRRGLVRCGHCREVFDASSSLYELGDDGDFNSARPITPDSVANLIAQAELEARGAAGGAETAGGAALAGGIAAAAAASHPAAAAGHDETSTRESAAPAAAPTAPAPSAPSVAQSPEPHSPAGGTPMPPASSAASADDGAPAAPHGGKPDFRAESWNPWAPAPDASVDRRIRQNAATIPYKPVTIPPDAQPKLKLEFTEGSDLHLENATARPVEPSFRTPPEPAAAPEVPVPPPAPVWRRAQARPEPSLEADDRTMVPPAVPDNEPHFGPAPGQTAAAAAAAPFAAAPFTTEPFAATPTRDDDDPFAVIREKRAPEPRRLGLRVFGGVIAFLLVLLLIAQLAWWQRELVMVYAPATRMVFAQACAQLGCTFSPPRDIDGLQVEPSDLRQVDGPHKLELKMPLHNRYNVALAYPAVELTLLDEHNNIAIRRVLWPQDYVRPGTVIAAGLAPRSTETMYVRLDTGPATATNFRVQIFYP